MNLAIDRPDVPVAVQQHRRVEHAVVTLRVRFVETAEQDGDAVGTGLFLKLLDEATLDGLREPEFFGTVVANVEEHFRKRDQRQPFGRHHPERLEEGLRLRPGQHRRRLVEDQDLRVDLGKADPVVHAGSSVKLGARWLRNRLR